MNTFATLTPEEGAFVVDLGSVQGFDRVMLRWNRTFNLRGRPDHIKIEVSNDNATFETIVANYDNSAMGSIMTNIVLPAQVKGRFVRIIPTGLLGVSPAVGVIHESSSGNTSRQIVSSIAQVAASTAFNLSAIEIYAFTPTIFFTVEGTGTLQAGDMILDTKSYANVRVVAAVDGKVMFKCLPPEGVSVSGIRIFRDRVDISTFMADDGTVSLTNICANTDITVMFNH
jgi:hypothetical protein